MRTKRNQENSQHWKQKSCANCSRLNLIIFLKQKRKNSEVKKIIVKGITERVGNYLKENNVNLKELSRKTGIQYGVLYTSAWNRNRKREMRVDEFFSICKALDIPTEMFQSEDKKGD